MKNLMTFINRRPSRLGRRAKLTKITQGLLFYTVLIIVIGIFVPLGVWARPADPNRFPKYAPLRLPAQNTVPNYSGNVNSSSGQNSAESDGDTASTTSGSEGSNLEQSNNTATTTAAAAFKTSQIVWSWGLVVLILALAGWYIFKRRKS